VRPHDYGYAIEANHQLHALWGAREFNVVINGHTHYHMVRTFEHLTIINAGTLKRTHDPCFLTADFQAQVVQFYKLHGDSTIIEGEAFNLPPGK